MQAAQLKADGKAQRVIVTGCLAQRYSEDLAGDTPLHIVVQHCIATESYGSQHDHKVTVELLTFWFGDAEQLPEADMVMGFQNYSSLPRHLRGMLGLSPELDSATYSGASRTQVCNVTRSTCLCRDCTLAALCSFAVFAWRCSLQCYTIVVQSEA